MCRDVKPYSTMPICVIFIFSSTVGPVDNHVVRNDTVSPCQIQPCYTPTNNLRLFNCRHTAQSTAQTSATQGGKQQQPPCWAALYTEGLSMAKLLPQTAHSS